MPVTIQPMPVRYRAYGRFKPKPPPIFGTREPAQEDVELARELFKELDEESKDWYRKTFTFGLSLIGDPHER